MIEIFVKNKNKTKQKRIKKNPKNIRGRKKAQNITTFEHD